MQQLRRPLSKVHVVSVHGSFSSNPPWRISSLALRVCFVSIVAITLILQYQIGSKLNSNSHRHRHSPEDTLTDPHANDRQPEKSGPTKRTTIQSVSTKTDTTKTTGSTDHNTAFIKLLRGLDKPFDFFVQVLPNIGPYPLGSDVVELRHCRLEDIDYHHRYVPWANYVLTEAWPNFEMKLHHNSSETKGMSQTVWQQHMVPEFALGLLEMYASHNGHCDYHHYPLRIETDHSRSAAAAAAAAERVLFLEQVSSSSSSSSSSRHSTLPRFVICIVAFKDEQHLARLIRAVHMPHHLIIIHLERNTSQQYVDVVVKMTLPYSNIVILQFGTVTYRTDSVSMINYRIMNWLVNDLNIKYDYHFTMGGAVYPLYSAEKLALHLQDQQQQQQQKQESSRRHVWLGELLHNGAILDTNQAGYLERKRLIFTKGILKYQQRTKKTNQNGFVPTIPDYIKTNMTKKTNSGNQAIFSYKFVKEMTQSAQVKELFALAKYGCCCCLEERTWNTAARLLGYHEQAMRTGSMYQVWGGKTTCGTSMNNAVLRLNASVCYKNEDANHNNNNNNGQDVILPQKGPLYVHGTELLAALKDAKKRGYMFARKFDSNDPSSMQLLDLIEKELHPN